jgi:hypothetical protein
MRDALPERVEAPLASDEGLRRWRPWLALAVGLALALSLARWRVWPDADVDSPFEHAFVLLYLGALFTLVAYLVLGRLVLPALAALPASARRRLLAVSLLLGLGGAALLGLQRPGLTSTLDVVATGQKQPAAQGSEVWVQAVVRGDGSPVPTSELKLGPGWEVRDGLPLSFQGQPATLHWNGTSQGDLRVRLVSHPWSGLVTLRWNGQEQTIDLYSPSATTYEAVLPSAPGSISGRLLGLLGAAADLLSGVALAFGFGLWLRASAVPSLLTGRRRLLTLSLLGLLALALSPPVATLIGPPAPRLVDHLAAWAYLSLLLLAVLVLLTPGERLLALLPEHWPGPLRWLGAERLGQARGAWLLAALACALVAWLLVARLELAGEQHAVWARLTLDAPGERPPEARLRFGPEADDWRPITWQPSESTSLALRPATIWREAVEVLALETDQGPLRFDELALAGAALDGGRLLLYASEGALLSWPQASRMLSVTLAPRADALELLWLDQALRVEASDQATEATLRLPAKFQGWALLPAQPVEELAIELPASDSPYQINELALLSEAPQIWTGDDPGDWAARGCALRAGTGLSVSTATGPCLIEVIGEQPLNTTQPWRFGLAWALLNVLLLGTLWLLARLAASARGVLALYDVGERHLGAWQRGMGERLPRGRALWAAWIVAMLFQLGYAMVMPISYTNDSLGYYELGRLFTSTARFADVQSVRTPGYPLFIGAVVGFFGDTAFWIVVAQHVALSLLAPLAVWALWPLIGGPGALLAGVAAGLAPAMAAAASILWTEALFSVLTAAALLLFVARGGSPRGLLLVGALAGLATMVRPTGLLVVLAILGWLLLSAWCAASRAVRQRAAMVGSAALLLGYLTTAGLWHLHLALVYQTADLSRGHASFTAWAMGVYQRQIDAELTINRPDRSTWAVPPAWGYDVFALINSHPQVLKGPAEQRQDFYAEGLREARNADPQQFRNSVVTSLLYNVTLRPRPLPPEQSGIYIYWSELSDLIWSWRRPKPPPEPEDQGLAHQMALMTYRWQPDASPPREALIGLSLLVLKSWVVLGPLLLLSLVPLLADRRLHALVPAWLFWLGLVLSSAAISTPAERYVAVAEPLVYTVLLTMATMLVSSRYRLLARQTVSDPLEPQRERTPHELRET